MVIISPPKIILNAREARFDLELTITVMSTTDTPVSTTKDTSDDSGVSPSTHNLPGDLVEG